MWNLIRIKSDLKLFLNFPIYKDNAFKKVGNRSQEDIIKHSNDLFLDKNNTRDNIR